jgi:bifunctional oligoribonuclease and PAP phosphatase NrnA
MLQQNKIEQAGALIKNSQKIVLLTHFNPDGDAVGSITGLYGFLIQLKKADTIKMILPNAQPDFLKWLPYSKNLINAEVNLKKTKEIILDADLIISLDFNTPQRINDLEESLRNSKASKITLDHHLEPNDYANLILSDTTASSTCQMVFDFAEQMGWKKYLNKDIAMSLYTGIMTDTGSFRFDSCTSTTHRIVAELLDTGVEKSKIHGSIYDTNSENRLRLLGKLLHEKLEVLYDYRTAFVSLNASEQAQFEMKKGDTEGFVNYGLSIENIVLSVFFVEREGEVKISFRSKGTFDVNSFARKYFNGGGHKNAAGANVKKGMDEVISEFITAIKSYKDELEKTN